MILFVGKATRVKGPRHERVARRRVVANEPATVLQRALAERGWVQVHLDEPQRGEWVDWVPNAPSWEFPLSVISDGCEEPTVNAFALELTRISIADGVHDDGSRNTDISVDFGPSGAFVCDGHCPPPTRTFPSTHTGVAGLLAEINDVEAHVVKGVELVACSDCNVLIDMFNDLVAELPAD